MAHRTETLIGDGRAVGVCSCGWVGPDRDTLGHARLDANEHRIDATRAEKSGGAHDLKIDPKQLSIPGTERPVKGSK